MTSRKNLKRPIDRGDPHFIREELLRPSPYLGYDRDQLGVHFLRRGAYELAESQFRRAVWLNPYEPAFKLHHAQALLRLGRKDAAHGVLVDLRDDQRVGRFVLELLQHYWPAES